MLKRPNLNKSDLLEYYIIALLTFGLPLMVFIYLDWRATLATFILTQIVVGLFALKATDKATVQ